MREVNFCFLR